MEISVGLQSGTIPAGNGQRSRDEDPTMGQLNGHNRSRSRGSKLTLSALGVTAKCGHALPRLARSDARWCSDACRQYAYRVRRDAAKRDRNAAVIPAGITQLRASSATSSVVDPASGSAVPVELVADPESDLLVIPPHAHDARLCAVCMTLKLEAVRRAPGARVNAEAVAGTIRRARGDVWRAVIEYGISYSHALRIRAGWRGAGRQAPAIRYRSRGWTDGAQNGSTSRSTPLRLVHPASPHKIARRTLRSA